MAPKRNMVTNIQGLRWASLLVKNQMASRRVRPTWDSTWLSMKNTSRKAMVELPKPLLKISPGDMIWKMARIAMHSRLGQSVPMKFHMSMMPMKIPMTCMLVWFRPAGAGMNWNSRMNAKEISSITSFEVLPFTFGSLPSLSYTPYF